MADRRLLVRGALALLAIGPLMTGIWAIVDPSGWYTNFPGLGRHWIAAEGPFNHHLIVDAGAGFLAVGVLVLVAAVWARREVMQVAIVAYLFHVVPHFVYHATHPVDLSAADKLLGIGSLGAQTALAVITLIAVSRKASTQPPHVPTVTQKVMT